MEVVLGLVFIVAGFLPFIVIARILINLSKSSFNKNDVSHSEVKLNNTREELYQQRAKEFTDAAERGDAEAQFKLAEVYEFYESDKYIYWLEKAVAQGHKEAIRELADAYQYGHEEAKPPIDKNLGKGLELLKMLADTGDIEAMKDISLCYSVEYNDEDKSREWRERAAEAGDIESMVELGDEYRLFSDISDFDKSEYWYKKAADLGDGGAMKGLGDLYCYDEERHDYFKAEMWYKKAVDNSHWFAYVRLGDMYKEGKGFTKDETMAFNYYKKAADKGESYGLISVAECYLNGCGVACNEKEGFKILEEAVKKGSFKAKYLLGLCYFNGTGVEKNYKKAVEYFQNSEYGTEANNMLGECYYFGYGVKEDKDKAHELWHNAAERGNEDAISNLKTYFYETIEPCDDHKNS